MLISSYNKGDMMSPLSTPLCIKVHAHACSLLEVPAVDPVVVESTPSPSVNPKIIGGKFQFDAVMFSLDISWVTFLSMCPPLPPNVRVNNI